jgi:phosphonate transport system permease protein
MGPTGTQASSSERSAAAVDAALARWRGRSAAGRRWRGAAAAVAMLVAVVAAWRLAGVDLGRLAQGVPRMGHWIAQAWPPTVHELPVFLERMAETVSIAFLGTLAAVLAAVPAALLAARGTAPWPALRWPLRGVLNAFRGIDAFVFALVFVAAVGLGPFAGLIGVALHTWGSAAKLFAEQIESMSLETTEALAVGGAGRLLAIRHALLPELAPAWASQALYLFEFNVRASTVLGVVGAGGIGHELKASMDLLDFARLATILAVILVAVTVIDAGSAWLRRRLA